MITASSTTRNLAILAISFMLALMTLLVAPKAHGAILYTGSTNQVVYVGETFVVEWYLDTQDKEINSISLLMTYSKDKVEVVEASTGNSAIDLWVKTPEVDANAATVKLIGGVSGGVKSTKLPIFRATFRPLEPGNAKISIDKSSQLLLGDGLGTSTPMIFNEVNFIVNPSEAKPAHIESHSHPDQDAWYKERNVSIKVTPKEGESYSYSFSSNLEVIPDENPDSVSDSINFNNLEDGIYYFKLNSRQGPSNWQEAGVYRVKIDATPPVEFTPALAKDPAVFNGQPFVSFNAKDTASGISYYEIKSGLFSGWQKTNESYFKLPGLVLGDRIEVKVVDAAGNERITRIEVDKSVVNSVFSDIKFWGIILVSVIAAAWLVYRYFKLLAKYKTSENK